ncbi:unnamed protein product [Ranitomeya imitator]|uniref:Reverse transcriptase n=1 Tax=Ranitomeya imitator TaxID=111125 RepID=A0ABN9L832_9NEOB|nr:unnamed protein product [Ranitomeya imitator]
MVGFPMPAGLNESMSLAIQIDRRLRERKTVHHLAVLSEHKPEPMQCDRTLTRAERQEHRRRNGLCFYCGDSTHAISDYPKRTRRFARSATIGTVQSKFLLSVTLICSLSSYSVMAFVDSGAALNLMDLEFARRCGFFLEPLQYPIPLRGIDATPLAKNKPQYWTQLTICMAPAHQEDIRFLVLHNLHDVVVLGLPWLQVHNPVLDWKSMSVSSWGCQGVHGDVPFLSISSSTPSEVPEFLSDYRDVFDEPKSSALPPHRDCDCSIDLIPGIKFQYPLPLLSDLFARIKGASWFTKIDLRGAYNLVRIKQGDEWKTAFNTPEGHFEYLVMPFGLSNAPSVFQSFMHDIFREYLDKFLIVYLDDILVFLDDWESHVKRVRMVFQVLRANSLFVKGSKCLFGVQKVSFLGFIFSPSTIEMDPVKVQAIYDWTQPTSLKSLQKFLGFANFYRRFINNFSSIAKPLTDLTKKGADVVNWSSAAVEAFQELKRRFSSAPVLCQPDVSLLFQVEVDASEIGAGAVLSQRSSDGSVMKPCAFFSRKFSPAERNYDVGNRELLAMKWAFEEWRHCLEGAKHRVVVLTDHKNLTYLESAKWLNPRQARWSLFFSRFDFVISYLPGSKNVKADALSRSFVPDSPGLPEPAGQVESSDCPGVDTVVDRLQQIWTHVVDNLTLSQEKAQRFANHRRCVGPRLRVGDLVWLSSRYIPMKVSSPKFKPPFIGPYRISEVLNPVSFRLTLPASFSIHNVFHRSLLRRYVAPVVPSVDPPAPVLVEGELEYVVEKILDSRISRRKLQYLVKWKGYGQEDNSWVLASDVHAADLVRAFHLAHPGRPGGSACYFGLSCLLEALGRRGSTSIQLVGLASFLCCAEAPRSGQERSTATSSVYFADANEAESWLKEHLPLVTSEDFGKDESSAEAILQRHLRLEKEISAYSMEVRRLGDQAQKVAGKAHLIQEKKTGNVITQERSRPQKRSYVALMPPETEESKQDPQMSPDKIRGVQDEIEASYENLQQLAKKRKKVLEEMVRLYQFYSACGEFQSWMDDKETIFQTFQPNPENVEVMQQKYENFLTDLAAGKARLGEINKMANELVKIAPDMKNQILDHMKAISKSWNRLEVLKEEKGAELIGLADVKTFSAKLSKYGNSDAGEEKRAGEFRAIWESGVGGAMRHTNPQESLAIRKQIEQMEKLLGQLKEEAQAKKDKLQKDKDQKTFLQDSHRQMLWIQDIKEKLTNEEMGTDVTSAEQLLRDHRYLLKEIDGQRDRIIELQQMGKNVLDSSNSPEVRDSLVSLIQGYNDLSDLWVERTQKLEQGLELHQFLREADSINAAISSHEAFLRVNDLGDQLDTVQILLNRHKQFEKVLAALNSRVTNLRKNGESLVAKNHFANALIKQRVSDTQNRYDDLDKKSEERQKQLLNSLRLQGTQETMVSAAATKRLTICKKGLAPPQQYIPTNWQKANQFKLSAPPMNQRHLLTTLQPLSSSSWPAASPESPLTTPQPHSSSSSRCNNYMDTTESNSMG